MKQFFNIIFRVAIFGFNRNQVCGQFRCGQGAATNLRYARDYCNFIRAKAIGHTSGQVFGSALKACRIGSEHSPDRYFFDGCFFIQVEAQSCLQGCYGKFIDAQGSGQLVSSNM